MTERTQIADGARKLQEELADSHGIVTPIDVRRLARLVERLAALGETASPTEK